MTAFSEFAVEEVYVEVLELISDSFPGLALGSRVQACGCSLSVLTFMIRLIYDLAQTNPHLRSIQTPIWLLLQLLGLGYLAASAAASNIRISQEMANGVARPFLKIFAFIIKAFEGKTRVTVLHFVWYLTILQRLLLKFLPAPPSTLRYVDSSLKNFYECRVLRENFPSECLKLHFICELVWVRFSCLVTSS